MTEESSNAVPDNANQGCVGPQSAQAGAAAACAGCPNQAACATGSYNSPAAVAQEQAEVRALQDCLSCISHVVLVLSGKGGVGKSTVAAQLSHTLAQQGYAIGLLDIDLCGPSAPRMVLGDDVAQHVVRQTPAGQWVPVVAHENLAVMSLSFLLPDPNAAVVWRGPRKNAIIQQFLTQVDWSGRNGNGLDYLIIDTPPGTSDEHISVVQYLSKAQAVSGALVVTTPEEVSLADVRKELSFCQKTQLPVLGIVENMGVFHSSLRHMRFQDANGQDVTSAILSQLQQSCPQALECTTLSQMYSTRHGGAAKLAADYQLEIWAQLPLDAALLAACENGQAYVAISPSAIAAQVLTKLAQRLTQQLPVEMAQDEMKRT